MTILDTIFCFFLIDEPLHYAKLLQQLPVEKDKVGIDMAHKITKVIVIGSLLCGAAVLAAGAVHHYWMANFQGSNSPSGNTVENCDGGIGPTVTPNPNCGNFSMQFGQARKLNPGLKSAQPELDTFSNGGGTGYELIPPSGSIISTATGSFSQVSNLTAIADIASPFSGNNGYGPNSYSVQLNTNQAPITDPVLCPTGCNAWLQTVFINGVDYIQAGSTGELWMQMWLFGINGASLRCPNNWAQKSTSACQFNTSFVDIPIVPVTEFPYLQISSSISGGQITATLTTKNHTYTQTTPDVMHMAQNWSVVDFNVYGHGNGTVVFFNPGASITVNIVASYSGNGAVTCSRQGVVGESNNLQANACTVVSGGNGIQYTESPF